MSHRNESPEFYVGYRPLPRRHAKFLGRALPAALLLLLALALGVALAQRDPGAARWETGTQQEWTGHLVTRPYPVIISGQEALLVVEMGKRGAQDRLAPHAGRTVRLSGFLLERAGRRMIELAPEDDAVTPLETTTRAPPAIAPGETVTLEGEILDAKCYLGAMKPGDGKAHKACATLCIRGGIPPMLYAPNGNGDPAHFLLAAQDGTSAATLVADLIGEPVVVRARTARLAGLDVLLVEDVARRR